MAWPGIGRALEGIVIVQIRQTVSIRTPLPCRFDDEQGLTYELSLSGIVSLEAKTMNLAVDPSGQAFSRRPLKASKVVRASRS